jgi:hypothetical protein
VASRIGDNNGNLVRLGFAIAKRLFGISPARGAETPVYLATSPEVAGKSGGYYEKCALATPSARAFDDAAALSLWRESARITGIED